MCPAFAASRICWRSSPCERRKRKINARTLSNEQIAVVTGAGSGIGRAIARELAARGMTVVVTDLDPGLCTLFCAKNIPTAANGTSGQNYTRTNIATLDPLLEAVDTNTNDAARAQASKAADRILAAQQVTLPLDPLPNIGVWSNHIGGVQGDNPVFAIFWNLSQWQAQ